MLAFAKFAMHSPSRVFLLAGVGSFLPILSFLSHALVGLVWLRMGPSYGIRVALAASLGAIYGWYYTGSLEDVFALVGLVALAEILRSKASWIPVLLVASLLGTFISLSYAWLPEDIQTQLLNLIFEHQEWLNNQQLSVTQAEDLRLLIAQLINGAITSVQLLTLIFCLIVARYWQAGLYNPGGFGQEFQALRLPLVAGFLVVASLGLVFTGQAKLMAAAPVLLIPHLLAGIALVHAWFKLKNYNSFWLGLLYVLLIFAQPYFSLVLVSLALADSLLNFRAKLAPMPTSSDTLSPTEEKPINLDKPSSNQQDEDKKDD